MIQYRSQPRQRAFTLLEVLVALAVVAFGLIALSKSSSSITANTVYLQQKNIAHWIALDRFMELENHHEWPGKGTKSDEVEMLGADWVWIQKVSDTPYKDMRRVDISVIQDGGDEDRPLVTLSGFLINPEILQQ